jgi:hypothetical protein
MNDKALHRPLSRRPRPRVKCPSATIKKRIFGSPFVATFARRIVQTSRSGSLQFVRSAGGKSGVDHGQGRQRICRERPSACVATSVSLSRLSRCSSTCAIVRTASVGQARRGAAPRTFPRMPSAWMVRTASIPGRATPGPASTTISARLAGQRFAGPGRPARHDLEFRSGCSPTQPSRLQRCRSGKNDDTGGRLPWTRRLIGRRSRLPAEALAAVWRQSRQPHQRPG